ncbi:tryptophan halogenase family protein [Streptomyces sp. NBC_01104]|uniref:tryptophan halogenase family protein n=1 Tax=Streptomyces sp. NBC_01104 TaxID=2903750 RepID=UPI003862D4C5|nr:tryptophan 7-halogenase [Streptomyces sp. NBC_01104]
MTGTAARIRKVVVLGGGTAGWMAAAYLGKALQGTVDVTVLAAPARPRACTGEATVPHLHRAFFDFLGINEDEWMRECDASFRTATRFVNWRTEGASEAAARALPAGGPDHFYQPFGLLADYDRIPLSQYWVKRNHDGGAREPFDYACFREPPLMDALKSPRRLDGRAATRYAWHLDAGLVADFLRRFAVGKLAVTHVEDEMTGVDRDGRGHVSALRTASGRVLEADLFVDCSGSRGLLLDRALGEPFLDMSDQLPCDSVVATTVPHDDAAHGVEPYTSALAMSAGWTWKTPLSGRFGTGYVYSSRFTTPQEATAELCDLWGLDPSTTRFEHSRHRVGRTERAWVRNVVGIGRSAGYLEPLESTGIHFVTAALHLLVKHFPDRTFNPALVDVFNREVAVMFDDARDLTQTHYHCTPRDDTPFWRATGELPLTSGVRERIAAYRAGLPVGSPHTDESTYYGDFEAEIRNLGSNGSYYCLLTGLGLLPDAPLPALAHRPESVAGAEPLFQAIKRQQQNLLETLPSAYDCLRRLHGA